METNDLLKKKTHWTQSESSPVLKTCIVYLRIALFSIEVICKPLFFTVNVYFYMFVLYPQYTMSYYFTIVYRILRSVMYFEIIFFWNGLFDWQLHTSPNMSVWMFIRAKGCVCTLWCFSPACVLLSQNVVQHKSWYVMSLPFWSFWMAW